MIELPHGATMALLHGAGSMVKSLESAIWMVENNVLPDVNSNYPDIRYRDVVELLDFLKDFNEFAYEKRLKEFEPLQQRYLALKSLKTE